MNSSSLLRRATSVSQLRITFCPPTSSTMSNAVAFKAAAPQAEGDGALTAAALMGMNNVWYPFVEMANDEDLKTQRPELRMNAYATLGGVEKKQFEAYALSASIIGKCHFCVESHYALLKKEGLTTQQLRDIGRIAAVVNAAAQVIAAS